MNTIIVTEFGADWHVFHGKQTNVPIQKLCPTIWMRPGMINIFPKVISICCVKTEIKETSQNILIIKKIKGKKINNIQVVFR